MCDVSWHQTQLRRLYMLLLAAAWYTATVFWLVNAMVHWGNCIQSKMPLLVCIPTQGNSTSHLWFVDGPEETADRIGFQSVNELYSKPPYLSEFCRPVSTVLGRWQLQSGILHVPRTKTCIGSLSLKSPVQSYIIVYLMCIIIIYVKTI